MAKVRSAIAQYESQVKSERLRMRYEAQTARGEMLAPKGTFGYSDEHRGKLEPAEAEEIRAAYAAVDAGRTVGSIVRDWNERHIPQRKGSKKWTYAHLNSILKRARNAGLVVDRDGNLIAGVVGKWEAIVEPEVFERVQLILSDPGRKSSPGFQPVYLSSGLARCGVCGRVMRSNTTTDARRGTRYPILRCSAVKHGERHASARVSDLEPLVRRAVIAAFTFGPAQLFPKEEGVNISGLQQTLRTVLERQSELLDLWREGVITKAELTAQRAKLKPEEDDIRNRIESARSTSATASMLIDLRAGVFSNGKASLSSAVDLKTELGVRFDALHIEQRRRLVSQLLEIVVHPGRNSDKYEVRHRVVTSLNS